MENDEIFSRLFKMTSELTDEYRDKGVPCEDLEQERALLISEYLYEKKHIDKSEEDIMIELRQSYSEKINGMITQDELQADVSNKILKRVNNVNDAAIKYKEDFFVKPTPKELADYLGVTEDYILDTVQMSGYEISDIDFEQVKGGEKGS